MKNNIFKFAFVAITAAVLSISCNKEKDNDGAIQKPVMVSLSGDSFFTDAKANVTATLTEALDHDVVVTLTPATKIAQKYTEPIDVDLVSAGVITIPAGAKEGSAVVTVDNSELPKGKYETQVVVSSCKGANMTSGDGVNIILLQGASTVSLAIDGGFSTAGVTTFTVFLDMYSEEDCVVEIEQLEFPGYDNVPSMAFSFDKSVTIKAGETEASGSVAIDLDGLYDSGRYLGALQIKSVESATEDKFEVDPEDYYSGYFFSFTASKKNHSWDMSYLGRMSVSGETCEVFQVSGVDGYFDYYVTPADTEEENSFIYPNLIADENAYLASKIRSGKTLDELLYNGDSYVAANKRAAGSYKLWILAVSEGGVCTGEYATLTFTAPEEPEPTAAYEKWLGQWTLGSSAESEKPIVVTISAKDVNQSYYVDGLEGVDTVTNEISATAEFNEDGTICIYPQVVGTWTHPSYGPATDVLAGQIVDSGKTFFVSSGDAPVAYGVIGADGTAILTPGTWTDDETGSVYGIVGLKYYWVVSAGAGSYSSYNTPLPNSLIPVKPEANPAALGSKKIDGEIIFRNQPAENKDFAGALTNHILLK